MRLRNRSSAPTRVTIPMAPMIGIVFQLLIFFMLNLKVVTSQGNFNLNMPISIPIGAPLAAVAEKNLPEIKLTLRSDREGNLTQLTLGSKNLGNDDAAFERLNNEIAQIVGQRGIPLSRDVEVEIDADFETQYKYVIKAISKCTGRFDPQTKQVARYIEKIKFAVPHEPKI